jgi:hypothetical protein
MNSWTPLFTSSSEYSNWATIALVSAARAMLNGLETGGDVGKGRGISQTRLLSCMA